MAMNNLNDLSETLEKFRRSELVRDSRSALSQNKTLDQLRENREARAEFYANFLRYKMGQHQYQNPLSFLPEVLAMIEEHFDNRLAVAIKEIKTNLKKALT